MREETGQTESSGRRPDQRPPFTCSRREFLPSLLKETVVTLGMLRGGRGGRLAELGSLPEDELALIKPIVNPAFELYVENDWIWSRYKETGAAIQLFSVEERASLVTFNLFNGIHNLDQIGRLLSEELGWDEAEGFAYARELFLSLVSHLVCIPKEPPSLDQPVPRGSLRRTTGRPSQDTSDR